MKNKSIQLILVITALIFSINAFSQKIYDGPNTSKNENTFLANGEHAYCMVTGGEGETGWSKMNIDPIGFENIGPKPTGLYFIGGDFAKDGKWYAVEAYGGFYLIDTVTTEYTLLADLDMNLSGFTYSPAYDVHYVCTPNVLYKIDMENYSLELIGSMGNSGNMIGIGADFSGKLWGIDTNDDRLYSIDPLTGASTAIGDSGFNFDYIQGCTYDKNNDIMYHGGFWVSPSVNGGLFTYDLETGTATEVAEFPNNQEVTVMSFPWNLPDHGSISGLVSDASNGNPIENVELKLEPIDGGNGSNSTIISESNGTYSFDLVLPGTYKITATSSSFGQTVVNDIIVSNGDQLEINIELNASSNSASFTVLNFDDNSPMDNVTVIFAGLEGTTDASGIVNFNGVSSGNFAYTSNYTGYYESFGELEISEGTHNETILMYEFNNIPVDRVIIEEFTGTWCGPCSNLAPTLDIVYEEGLPINFVAYHGNDPYENVLSSHRIGYYGVMSFPTLVFMGQTQTAGVVSQTVIENHINTLLSQETPVSIELLGLSVDLINNTVTGTAKVENYGPINSDYMRLHLVLIENHVPEEWQGLSELNFVARATYPDINGIELDFSSVGEENYEFTLSLDDIIDFEHATIVAFVQDNWNKNIYNGNSIDCNLITGVKDVESSSILTFPNPATNQIYIKAQETINSVKIYNSTGQLVIQRANYNSNSSQINIESLSIGVYYIKLETEQKEYTQKLIKR